MQQMPLHLNKETLGHEIRNGAVGIIAVGNALVLGIDCREQMRVEGIVGGTRTVL
ncbi:hypothetical protein KSC_032200 [Ktedonobacter sp. SOSP1-52]|nr:hypothetical protein KSC_032200 [Ktedonobacter sp. SOSP1-52]